MEAGARLDFLALLGEGDALVGDFCVKVRDRRDVLVDDRLVDESPEGFDLDHAGLPGFEINRAVNVDALASARLLDREFLLARRPAADRPRGMRWMRGVHEQHGLVGAQGIQQFFVKRDERLLLCFVELARGDLLRVVFEPKAIRKRDQSRAALVNDAELRLDKGADRSRRARQTRRDPCFQLLLLRAAELAGRAFMAKLCQPIDPIFLIKTEPGSDRGVVDEQNPGDLLEAQAIQQHQRVHPARQPMHRRAVPRQSDQVGAVFPATGSRRESCPPDESKNRLSASILSALQ